MTPAAAAKPRRTKGAKPRSATRAAADARRADPRAALASLRSLHAMIVDCDRCPRLREYCAAIAAEKKRAFRDQEYWGRPVPGFGDPRARLLIVGLAPAAHGGNRTGRVFTGDSSGSWLYEELHHVGFASQPFSTGRDDGQRLSDAYITAAAHCAPPANKPTPAELAHCRGWLEAEIRLLTRVRVVLALGRIAHDAWLRATGLRALPARQRPAFAHGAETRLASGITLLCSYHPSRQNTNTGTLTRAMWREIFRRVRKRVDELGRP